MNVVTRHSLISSSCKRNGKEMERERERSKQKEREATKK